MAEDVENGDLHSAKIVSQRTTLEKLAIDWAASGKISDDEKQEIIYLVKNAQIADWRPLLFIIPRHLVSARLELVPIDRRASPEKEYIIRDLKRSEFEIIER